MQYTLKPIKVNFKSLNGTVSKEILYDADPNCEHEEKPNNWSGIKCKNCGGWFCY